MIKVVICDHDPQRCEGLRKVFCRTEDVRIAAEARTGEELWGVLADTPCDAVILGVSLESTNGLAGLTDELHARRPALPVVVLSMNDQGTYAVRVLRLGSAGYLPLICPPSELAATLRAAVSGGAPAGVVVQDRFHGEETRRAQKAATEHLSARELQVILGLASDVGIAEIARNLHVKPSALGSDLARVLSKLGLHTSAQLVRLAIRNKLLR